jgi:hypothetical protein
MARQLVDAKKGYRRQFTAKPRRERARRHIHASFSSDISRRWLKVVKTG